MHHDLNMNGLKKGRPILGALGRISPRGERMANQVRTLWNHLYNDARSLFIQDETQHIHPRIDVLENKNLYDIRIDLPGVDAGSIDLQTQGKVLTVKAKRQCGEAGDFKMSHCEHNIDIYERGIHLADDAIPEEKSATFADGILSIRVPRKAA